MKPTVAPWKHALAMLVLLVLALVARLHIVMLDMNSLLTSYLVDDAFYYYKIAANLFNLHRVTYDGEGFTNGFHPLWLALIAPFYTAADDGAAFVARVQWIMLFLHLLTVPALYLAVWRIGAGWFCTLVVTAVFCLHSTFVDMQLNGLETSLNTLLLLVLLHAFLSVWQQPLLPLRRYAFFGVVAGCAFLARTDNAISLVVLFSFLAWSGWAARFQVWPRLLVAGLLALVMATPWLAWNQLHFGSMVQSSGRIETILWGEPKFTWSGTALSVLLTPMQLHDHLQDLYRLIISPLGNRAWCAGVLLGSWLLAVGWLSGRRRPAAVRAAAVFVIAVVAVFAYHAGIRNFVRIWYHIPLALALLVTIGCCAAALRANNALRALGAFNVALLLWFSSVLWWFSPAKLPGFASDRSPHLVVAEWLNANTADNAVIGSMNSGILSYLVHRKVINLDGVVDARSMRAHWDKRREVYAHQRGIQYLVDNAGAIALFCGDNSYYRCEPVFTFGDTRNPSYVIKLVAKGIVD